MSLHVYRGCMAKVCIVFGGSRGIGKAIAYQFGRDGFNVAVASKNAQNVNDCVTGLRKLDVSGDVLGFECDVTSESDIKTTVQNVLSECNSIDVLVNAAGINKDGLLLTSKLQDIMEPMNTNLLGSILTSRAVLKTMMKQKSGCIINIGSIVGLTGNAGQCIYSASKAGLTGFTKSLAKEMSSRGIRVNTIAPGFINTQMTTSFQGDEKLTSLIPLSRFGEPEEVAHMARFLANASYITGQVIRVDGGLSLKSS